MTYYNIAFMRGPRQFAEQTRQAGLEGAIIPDLPFEEGDLLLSKLPTSGDTIEVATPPSGFVPCSLDEMERRHIEGVLNSTRWNKSKTAEILGIDRRTLYRKLRQYGARKGEAGVALLR